MVKSSSDSRSLASSAWRFVLAGASNTLVTTVLLIGLSYIMEAWLAYTVAFGVGLVYSTIFASRWVFTRAGSRRATILYAFCYVGIYFVGLGCIVVIGSFEWPEFLNALSVLVTAPLGFVTGRLVFRERQRKEIVNE